MGAKKRKHARSRRNAEAVAASAADPLPTLQDAYARDTAGDREAAERMYRRILEREPANDTAMFLLGIVELERNAHAAARELFERALALNGKLALYWLYLGRALHALDQHAAALIHFKRAREFDPKLLEAWLCEGTLFQSLGALARAESTYLEAAAHNPEAAIFHEQLGALELARGQLDKAAERFARALQLNPRSITAATNLGATHDLSGRLEQARACFERACEIEPESAVAHANLGGAQWKLGQLTAAEGQLRTALSLDAGCNLAWVNLATIFLELGEVSESLSCYRRAFAIAPSATYHTNMIGLMLYDPTIPPTAVLAEARRWGELHAPTASQPAYDLAGLLGSARLRIGYVSPDFREHAVAHFMEPVLAAHDASRFEILCYSNVKTPDEVTARMARHAQFRAIRGHSDADVAAQIRADGVHILVDLAGHTLDHRLALFGLRPAPVQATYLGYPGTTGVASIGYRFTDALADPQPSADLEYSERLVRLPEGFFCFRPPEHAPDVSALPRLERGHITFGSLNRLSKLSTAVFDTWTCLLARLPDARLILQNNLFSHASVRERVWTRFATAGVARERVELHPWLPFEAHMRLYREIDIALDMHPWNGHTTTCLALHMGVPVISLVGDRFGGRMGLAILQRLGLTDWLATTPEQYVEIAIEWARDVTALAELRQQLRSRLASSSLCDAASFARGLEAAYETLWRECITKIANQ